LAYSTLVSASRDNTLEELSDGKFCVGVLFCENVDYACHFV